MQGIEQPFFSELRTKQQTGYIVMSDAEDLRRIDSRLQLLAV